MSALSPERNERIPVYSKYGMQMVDPRRAAWLARAGNAEVVRRRRDHRILRINLRSHVDADLAPGAAGNPQKLTHCAATDTNPAGVWAFKRAALFPPAALALSVA